MSLKKIWGFWLKMGIKFIKLKKTYGKKKFEELTKEEKEDFAKECAEFDVENFDTRELYSLAYDYVLESYLKDEQRLKETYEFRGEDFEDE